MHEPDELSDYVVVERSGMTYDCSTNFLLDDNKIELVHGNRNIVFFPLRKEEVAKGIRRNGILVLCVRFM